MESNRKRGELFKLSQLFDIYKKRFHAPQASVIRVFIEVVKDLTGYTVEQREVSYNVGSQTLSIHCKEPLKSEILLQKKHILTHMKGRLSGQSTPRYII